MFGIDYAWKHPPVSALRAAGVRFVCRYLSHDPSKNLTAAEANALWKAGIAIVVCWEYGARDMLRGYSGGQADARNADAQARACGLGAVPVYFACDFDATPGEQGAINAYLDGAASILGRPRVGIYGGYWPLSRALSAGKAAYAWQTIAWSGVNTDPRRHIMQGPYITIGGVQCDRDEALRADFGQFPRPAPDPPHGGSALTPAVCTWQNRRFEFGLAPYGHTPRSVYYRSYSKVAGAWRPDQKDWADIGGAAAAGSGVSAAITDEGEVFVTVIGTDGAMWHNSQPPGGRFDPHGWASDGGKFA